MILLRSSRSHRGYRVCRKRNKGTTLQMLSRCDQTRSRYSAAAHVTAAAAAASEREVRREPGDSKLQTLQKKTLLGALQFFTIAKRLKPILCTKISVSHICSNQSYAKMNFHNYMSAKWPKCKCFMLWRTTPSCFTPSTWHLVRHSTPCRHVQVRGPGHRLKLISFHLKVELFYSCS